MKFAQPHWKEIWQYKVDDEQMNIPLALYFYFQVNTLKTLTHVL